MRRLSMRIALILGVSGVIAILVTGCSALPFGKSTPVSSVTESQDAGGDVDFEAAIGDCVKLTGDMVHADIEHATCGQAPANYVVVAKAPTKEACPSDIDQTYYVTQGGKQQGALCLDTDWAVGQCMTVPSFGDPAHVDCSSTDYDARRILAVRPGTTDDSECPEGTTNYYTYKERHKLVCVEKLS
ncbi:LppU family putative lipoprotein [Gordonia sp. DT30]|uniref:LppU family putative lipoprotein n=1 Tax=unclassified Gordonia (in: high G+C Gram-positive bacteria) TaxID=2657482 RepID=UPI003CF58C3B